MVGLFSQWQALPLVWAGRSGDLRRRLHLHPGWPARGAGCWARRTILAGATTKPAAKEAQHALRTLQAGPARGPPRLASESVPKGFKGLHP